MAEDVSVDSVGPWTIKSVSTATREAVTEAARKEGMTVGHWLDRRVREWLADGQPTVIPGQKPRQTTLSMVELTDTLRAAQAVAESSGVPVPSGLAREAYSAIRQSVRASRGLPPRSSPVLISGKRDE